MTVNPYRERYIGDSVAVASPAKLLTMLYDRLARDLAQAERALGPGGDAAAAHEPLLHAQEIVLELRSSLVVDAWDGATALASLYDWLVSELIAANLGRDGAKVAACSALVEPLRLAWHDAAASVSDQSAPQPA